MKKLIFLFLFAATLAATSCAQTANEYWKNTTLTYSKIPPTWTPSSAKANELVIDTSTYTWFQWSHTSHGWVDEETAQRLKAK